MTGGSVTLNDIANSISALSDLFDRRLDKVELRLDGVERRLTTLELSQHDIRECLDRVEGETQALRNDVAELYDFVR